ncbi:unnamed protein product [Brassicogethes aeneus]|uniref:NELF-A N-terminal domain-containing protein n=1 Tax=Brassicogethes aeneus TaxID=1431903 RepID=A0A9P0FE10_BRAAE|nr:unnamed protein product [Brassicogethes aeneus]
MCETYNCDLPSIRLQQQSNKDHWNVENISLTLSEEKLKELESGFEYLDNHVKIKILVSFLNLDVDKLRLWDYLILKIIDLAIDDFEIWVSSLGSLLRNFVTYGEFNLEIYEEFPDSIKGIISAVREDLKNVNNEILPKECQYMNKQCLDSLSINISKPEKHFTIKKKTKAYTLREQLLIKAQGISNRSRTSFNENSRHFDEINNFQKKENISMDLKYSSVAYSPYSLEDSSSDTVDGAKTPRPLDDLTNFTNSLLTPPPSSKKQKRPKNLNDIPKVAEVICASSENTPQQVLPPVSLPGVMQKRKITKEIRNLAKTILENAGKVTRPQKAQILGFLCGNRENPSPHFGPLVTIALSETEIPVTESKNGVKVVEQIYFQMDYRSGQWRRVRKYRVLN